MYSLGMDIGYASVKLMLIDENRTVCLGRYQLHKGDVKGALRRLVQEMGRTHDLSKITRGAATGSGARIFDKRQTPGTVNEVAALVEGVRATAPNARSIIEIGGQSAKYITGLDETEKSRVKIAMNSNCSAGTGSFLEEQVSRLGLKLEDYSFFASRAKTIPRIAGRCSVFAKTDITHHQQEGVPVADILLGLAHAVVRNFRVAVMKKLSGTPPTVLAGGVARNQGVVSALKDVLGFENGQLILPDHMDRLGALGAAVIAQKDGMAMDIDTLFSGLDKAGGLVAPDGEKSRLPALDAFGRNDQAGKHEITTRIPPRGGLDCFLGVDVGSTSTNLVVLDEAGRIMGFRYLKTLGDPVRAVQTGLLSLKQAFNSRLNVKGACTTGSGRYMIARLIGADAVKDEITAQAKAAVAIDPKVDTVFEIGGQDSKFIFIENGVVTDFQMNKVCAAGTGSFLEEQAKKFNIPVDKIGPLALTGTRPVPLGERCTVFMETSIAAHLGAGAKMENITAGLCYAIVKNYLNRVKGQKRMGDTIFFQGGVAHNQGVVNAFRCLTGKNIIVPPFFSVTGAYGAALLAREAMAGKKSEFKGFHLFPQKTISSGETKTWETNKPFSRFNQSVDALVFEGYTGAIDPKKKDRGHSQGLVHLWHVLHVSPHLHGPGFQRAFIRAHQ